MDSPRQKNVAQQRYRDFILQSIQPSPWHSLKSQIYLGNDAFIFEMRSKIDPEQSLKVIPKMQKTSPVKPLEYFAKPERTRKKTWRWPI